MKRLELDDARFERVCALRHAQDFASEMGRPPTDAESWDRQSMTYRNRVRSQTRALLAILKP